MKFIKQYKLIGSHKETQKLTKKYQLPCKVREKDEKNSLHPWG